MKLSFSYWIQDGRRQLVCKSDLDVDGRVSPIASLLCDDGGLDFGTFLGWIDEGLKTVASVLDGERDQADWDCEHWGALIRKDETRVYWFLDESHGEVIATDKLQYILKAWRDYLASATTSDAVIEVN